MNGEQFKAIRVALGFHQKDMAAVLGKDKQTIYQKESGKTSVSPYDVKCLHRLLAMHLEKINQHMLDIEPEIEKYDEDLALRSVKLSAGRVRKRIVHEHK